MQQATAFPEVRWCLRGPLIVDWHFPNLSAWPWCHFGAAWRTLLCRCRGASPPHLGDGGMLNLKFESEGKACPPPPCTNKPQGGQAGIFHCQVVKIFNRLCEGAMQTTKIHTTGHRCTDSRHIGKSRTIFLYARTRVLPIL